MRKVQILLLAMLLLFNAVTAAGAVTITLNGTLDPVEVDVSVPASLTYILPVGVSMSDPQVIDVVNNTDAPVRMYVDSMTVDTEAWPNLTMMATDALGDNYWERNKRAAYLIAPVNAGWYVNPTDTEYIPMDNGEGATSLTSWKSRSYGWQSWETDATSRTLPFQLGVINPLQTATLNTYLHSDSRRYARNFAGALGLTFELDQP
jgi:hypothetical protein